jgi:hypothetical protein
MPSPFPGMDPYLESPDIWPDFHNRLATQMSSLLNLSMPPPYYARLEMRPEVGVVEEEGYTRRIVPDVAVVRHPWGSSNAGATGVLDAPRADISKFYEFTSLDESIQHQFVEVRDASRGHKLITLIEIVSPTNKRRGPDQDSYRQKQREVLASDASLIEIDLLRSGGRLFAEAGLYPHVARLSPPPDYIVLVNRAWRRGKASRGYQIFPVTVRELLPCFPVPLREGEKEVLLDLQFAFNRAYDEGPYRRGAVDYRSPPDPPLAEEHQAWATELLQPI